MKKICVVAAFAAVLSLGILLRAEDTVVLDDGSVLKGQVIEESSAQVVLMGQGIQRTFDRSLVAKVEYDTTPTSSQSPEQIDIPIHNENNFQAKPSKNSSDQFFADVGDVCDVDGDIYFLTKKQYISLIKCPDPCEEMEYPSMMKCLDDCTEKQQNLKAEGKCLEISHGIRARVLEISHASCRIELLNGSHVGEKAWCDLSALPTGQTRAIYEDLAKDEESLKTPKIGDIRIEYGGFYLMTKSEFLSFLEGGGNRIDGFLERMYSLQQEGKFVTLSPNTNAKIMEIVNEDNLPTCYRISIIDGPYAGEEGWTYNTPLMSK